jgi:hypothetical protein
MQRIDSISYEKKGGGNTPVGTPFALSYFDVRRRFGNRG